MRQFKPVKATGLALLFLTSHVLAHSWVEQLVAIASNGTMVGQPGFPRSNVLRSSPTFSDTAMVWLIPPNGGPINQIDSSQMMCRPEQTTQTQSAGSPRLKAAPGQSVALRYQENGHVTLPQNQPGKPAGSGANFVYFTNSSRSDDKFLDIHRQWTADGKGGDGRGRLISTQNFDDSQCYQVNGGTISVQRQVEFKHKADSVQGADLWCQSDIKIPTDAQVGSTVTLYWVWDWPTLPGTAGFPQGKQEIYTTCMDIDVIAPIGNGKAVAQGFIQQDFGKAAVSSQFANIGNPTAVKAQMIPFSSVGAASSSGFTTQITTSSAPVISVQPVQTGRSSTSSTSSDVPDVVTVTVQQTVTATTFSTVSRRPNITVTDFETVFVTQTIADDLTSSGSASTVRGASSSTPSAGCNTTVRAFRLRARNALYILPSSDGPSSTAGSGC